MIDVTVKFYGILRTNVVKEASRQFTLDHCAVEDLINELIQHYGEELKEKFIDPETSQLTNRLVMFVNGTNVKNLQGPKTELKDGDLIAIFPPSGGG
ncbi:MAG: MoaD/ThiS family protein [Promethearchaeota archaeon]